jgi:omega-amidase
MALAGRSKMVIVPASFNMTTGPAHWELSFRSQAVFNQFCSLPVPLPSQDDHSSYRSYGHTLMVDPWGQVTGQLDEKSGVLISEIDLDMDDRIRSQLPLLENRRSDVYQVRTLD